MSSHPSEKRQPENDPPPTAGLVEPPAEVDETVAGPDRISPAIMIGVFVILLLCVVLVVAAY